MSIVLVNARGKVNDTKFTFIQFKLGGQDIGIFKVILFGLRLTAFRHNTEFAAFFLIQQRTENKTTVEPWHAQPVNIGMSIDIRQVGAVAYDPKIVFVDIRRHTELF